MPAALPLPRSPWQVSDVFGVAVTNVVGLGMLLGGLQGTRHSTDPHTLLLLLNVATAGVVVAFAGNAVFVLSTLRQVGQLRTLLLGRRSGPVVDVRSDDAIGTDPVSTDALVAAESMTRFHRATCAAVRGKAVTATPLADHLAAGRRPCGMCAPDLEPVR